MSKCSECAFHSMDPTSREIIIRILAVREAVD